MLQVIAGDDHGRMHQPLPFAQSEKAVAFFPGKIVIHLPQLRQDRFLIRRKHSQYTQGGQLKVRAVAQAFLLQTLKQRNGGFAFFLWSALTKRQHMGQRLHRMVGKEMRLQQSVALLRFIQDPGIGLFGHSQQCRENAVLRSCQKRMLGL